MSNTCFPHLTTYHEKLQALTVSPCGDLYCFLPRTGFLDAPSKKESRHTRDISIVVVIGHYEVYLTLAVYINQ